MSLSSTPYVGTWKMGGKSLVAHTPDALVYINGDTAMPGCPKCHRRIDLQQYLTEVSVEAGTEPGGASSTFTLSIPIHDTDSFTRDAKFILRPGLEVHVYMRGYFPVEGMFSALSKPTVNAEVVPGTKGVNELHIAKGPAQMPKAASGVKVGGNVRWIDTDNGPVLIGPIRELGIEGLLDPSRDETVESLTQQERENLTALTRNLDVVEEYIETMATAGSPWFPDFKGDLRLRQVDAFARKGHTVDSEHKLGQAADMIVRYETTEGKIVTADKTTVWAAFRRLQATGHIEKGGIGAYFQVNARPGKTIHSKDIADFTAPTTEWSFPVHYDRSGAPGGTYAGRNPRWTEYDVRDPGPPEGFAKKQKISGPTADDYLPPGILDRIDELPDPDALGIRKWNEVRPDLPVTTEEVVEDIAPGPAAEVIAETPPESPEATAQPTLGNSLLEDLGLGDTGIDQVIAYPYYHVFHGVTTGATFNYASGVQTINMQCSSLLHFWGYQQLSEQGAIFGSRPSNSKLKVSLEGNNFTSRHPYEIIYDLYSDVGGAAGGIGWSHEQATNADALSFTGDSLYSLTMRYWEERFKGRMNKLRLHGATGEMFSTFQSAYMSTLPTDVLTGRVANRHALAVSKNKTGKEPLNRAFITHLLSKASMDALLLLEKAGPTLTTTEQQEVQRVNMRALGAVNIAELEPWPIDLGRRANFETFESTYITKMDVAQKCMEVTGFEFYQDVDGDYVFKPPMYNLDTSSSRVYRIEDIDIISINFSEKEPTATHIIAKGNWFRNVNGTGVVEEFAPQGRYIDWRLVAQFGWRPTTMETSYYNDPKSIFYAAVARLDILNAPANSATVTIPIRAELRPGYPIYIRYLDCFYYCPSFNHSYSNGGSCQTTLQLVAKRAKFYAPGRSDPHIRGVGAIDLSNTYLPERPLEVMDENNRPRLSGFPNVVMALDPTQLNPLFSLVGSDRENLGDPQNLENLLQKAWGLGLLQRVQEGDSQNPIYTYVGQVPDSTGKHPRKVRFTTQGTEAPLKTAEDGVVEVDVGTVGSQNRRTLEQIQNQKEDKQREIRDLGVEVSAQESQTKKVGKGTTDAQQHEAEDKLKGKGGKPGLYDVERRMRQELEDLSNPKFSRSGADGAAIAVLDGLIKLVGSKFNQDGDEDFPDKGSTSNLLDLLNEKKANFAFGQQWPGVYRYYSASHPDKEQQGQLKLSVKRNDDATGVVKTEPAPLSEPAQVTGYVKSPSSTFPNGEYPEAELVEQQQVQWGITISTARTGDAKGRTVPTSDIKTLAFARHELDARRPLTTTKREPVLEATVAVAVTQTTVNTFTLDSIHKGQIQEEDTMRDIFEAAWGKFANTLLASDRKVSASRIPGVDAAQLPPIIPPEFPDVVEIGGEPVVTSRPAAGVFEQLQGAGVSATSMQDSFASAAYALSAALNEGMTQSTKEWLVEVKKFVEGNKEAIEAAEKAMAVSQAAQIGVQPPPAKETRQKQEKWALQTVFESPVFPVSDDKGYTVIGSYRYGRDIDVDPDGVFDILHKQDPATMLSRELVEAIISVVVDGKQIVVYDTTILPNGQEKQIPRNSTTRQEAVTALEKRALAELREYNLTDKDLLNLGLAKATGNASVLELKLQNFVANKDSDMVMKIPLVNAAYSLADLIQAPLGQVCSCKAAEANIQLEAFGQEEFAQIDPRTVNQEAMDSPDQLTQWLGRVTGEAVDDWRDSQDAMRGTILDTPRTNVVQSFLDVADGRLGTAITVAEQQFKRQQDLNLERIKSLAEGIGEDT